MRIEKGDRIGARWFMMGRPVLASSKREWLGYGATAIEIIGIVRHLRGDHPEEPTEIVAYVEPDGPIPDVVRRERPYGCMCPGHDDLVPVRSQHVRWKETP